MDIKNGLRDIIEWRELVYAIQLAMGFWTCRHRVRHTCPQHGADCPDGRG